MVKDSNSITKPLLSFIVPTRFGGEYIYHTLDNLLTSDDFRFQVVVNVNAFPQTLDLSKYLGDKRIKINIEINRLSMSENWFMGLVESTGIWVCFVGSDDGIIPKNLTEFLDFLEKSSSNIVTSHETFFQYQVNGKLPWMTAPVKKPTKKSKTINWPIYLSAFFPQFNYDMPQPYNKAIVKRKVLEPLLLTKSKIPGMAPDLFLGQYIAQKTKKGNFFDLCLLMRGSSRVSTGFQYFTGVKSNITDEFLSDIKDTFSPMVQSFSVKCRVAVAIDSFLCAYREINAQNIKIPNKLLRFWCLVSCLETGHHNHKIFKITLPLRKTFFNTLAYGIRKIWFIKNFHSLNSSPNRRFSLSTEATINTAASKISAL